ncbi:hypothetical protein BMETH_3377412431851, partial [methanotrophic bacterial endosymbiont of Bathymodiolus sp.]
FIIKKQSYQEDLPLDLPEPTEKLPAKLALEKHGIGEAQPNALQTSRAKIIFYAVFLSMKRRYSLEK